MRVISNHESEILKYLMMNGSSIGNHISRGLRLPTSTVSTVVLKLQKRGFINIRPGVTFEIPHPHNLLNLTLRGLSVVLAGMRASDLDIESIKKKWGHLLPFVLEKWDLFGSAGVENLAWRNLDIAIGGLVTGTQYPPYRMSLDHLPDPVEMFYHNFYHSEIGLDDREERLRWARACAIDTEVRDYLIEKLRMIIEGHRIMAREAEVMLQELQGKDERKTISALDNEDED